VILLSGYQVFLSTFFKQVEAEAVFAMFVPRILQDDRVMLAPPQ
jgi:hypothetical protein